MREPPADEPLGESTNPFALSTLEVIDVLRCVEGPDHIVNMTRAASPREGEGQVPEVVEAQ